LTSYDESQSKKAEISDILGESNASVLNYSKDQMSELASNSDIENLYYTDSNFLITASNASNPSNLFTTDLFKSFITDQKATDITYNNVLNRYYLCSIIDDSSNLLGYSIIANDPKSTYAQLETLSSVSYALNTIMTDKDGFVFAINSKTSKIAYYSDEDLIGKDASTLGLSSSNLTNDYSGWIDIKNLGNYYCVSKEANDLTIFYAATSKTSINSQRTQVVATEVIIIAAVITLIIAFAFILRNESIKRNKPEDKVKFKKLYYNKYTGARIDGIMLFAVIMVGVLSYFSQSLYSVSNTSTHSEKTISSINTQMVFEQSQTSSIIEGYEDSYLKKGNSIAYMIKESPNLNDDSALNTLAKDSSVEGIYVFNKDGVTEHTNTNYKDFALSTNPDDQSYAFWDVVKGYKDYVIQDAQIGDNGAYIQYIGVKRQDAKGMIQLAITPSYLSSLLKTTTLKYNLDNYKAANDGIFVDINKADSNIKYYSQSEKLVGDSYTKIGLTEAALNDSYAGYQTISGVKYFVNSLLIQDETNGDYFLYLAIPSISYSQTEFNIALITT